MDSPEEKKVDVPGTAEPESAQPGGQNHKIPRWKKILFAFVALLALFVAAEILVRVVFLIKGKDINRYRLAALLARNEGQFTRKRFQPHPFLPYVPSPGDERTIAIYRPMIDKTLTYKYKNNFYGCRGPDVTVPKPEGVKRILTFGGSTTWDGPEDSKTWPAVLEKKLRGHYGTDKIEAVNFAVDGGNSPISLVRLALTGLDLEPDLVIVYHGANDLLFIPYENLQGDYTPLVCSMHPDPPTPLQFRAPRFFLWSYIFSIITYRIDRKYFKPHLHQEVYPAFKEYADRKGDDLAKMDIFLRNLKTMRGIAREHGAKFLGSTFHWIENTESTTRLNERLRGFFEKEKIAYADVDRKLPHGSTDIHVDEVHFTAKGLERMASIFLDEILSRDLLEPGEGSSNVERHNK